MTRSQRVQDYPTFNSKAHYQIAIQGYIDPSWSDRLGGLAITSGFDEQGRPTTILNGTVTDQSALIGIINSIYEMHLPLLSVSFVGE